MRSVESEDEARHRRRMTGAEDARLLPAAEITATGVTAGRIAAVPTHLSDRGRRALGVLARGDEAGLARLRAESRAQTELGNRAVVLLTMARCSACGAEVSRDVATDADMVTIGRWVHLL